MPGKNGKCFDLWQAHGSIHLPVYLRSNNFVLFQTLTLWKWWYLQEIIMHPWKKSKGRGQYFWKYKNYSNYKKNCSPSQIVFCRCSALYVHLFIYYGIKLQRQHQGGVPQKSWHKRIGRQLKNTNADLPVKL